MNKALVSFVALLASSLLAEPQPVKSFRVAVEVPGQDQLRFGTLSLTPEGVKFESDELLFTVPVKDMDDIQVAGFRERFLTLLVRKDSEFARSYAFLFSDRRTGTTNMSSLSFQLGPKETLRTAVETGRAYREQITDQLPANQASPGALPTEATRTARAAVIPADAPPPGLPKTTSDPPHTTPALPSSQALRELFRLSGRYIEKRKGLSSFVLTGTPGDLVFFEDAIGFRSQAQNPHLGADKAAFIQDGYLKFRVGDKDIESVSYQPMTSNNTVLVLTINRKSSFYAQSKPLLTETKNDNELVFLVPSGSSQGQLPGYFHSRISTVF